MVRQSARPRQPSAYHMAEESSASHSKGSKQASTPSGSNFSDPKAYSEPIYTSSVAPKKGSGSTHAKVLHLSELQAVFHLPMAEAALKLGVCSTVLKKICRRNGISKWPYRQIRKIDKAVSELQENAQNQGVKESRRSRGGKHKSEQLLKLRQQIIKQPDVDHSTALECALNDEKFNLDDLLQGNASKRGPEEDTGSGSSNAELSAALFPAASHSAEDVGDSRASFFESFRDYDFGFPWPDNEDLITLFKGESSHDLFVDPLFSDLFEDSPALPRQLKRSHEESTLDPSELVPIDVSNEDRKRPRMMTLDLPLGGPLDTEQCASGVSVW